ncbi:MAG: BNR-repeat neuraminidase N-terminal domain-containing protein [Bacteroidota bacterium]
MSRRLRQNSSLKTSLRITLIAAAFAVSGLVALLIVVFNLTKEQISEAETNMSFKNAVTIQDTLSVLRGSINQRVIGIIVETTGRGNAMKLTGMEFNANGTSTPVSNQIENARLWCTGSSREFTLTQQSGTTVININDELFSFNCSQSLLPGKNYFWLTYDIKPDAVFGPGSIDAECVSLRIGAITYQPDISAPAGKRFTMPNIPFYSTGNNVVNNVMAWNSKRDGTGIPPKQLYAARHTYFVQAGHHMINASATNLHTLVVEKGGELRITSPLRLSAMNIACGGTVQMDAAVTDYFCFDEFNMDDGANYIHNNTGYMPGRVCNFSAGSTQAFFQYGGATFPAGITWGNLVIDATTPVNMDLENCINHVAGNLEIRKTAKDNYIYIGQCDTVTIDGSFVMTGGSFMGIAGPGKGQLVMNIGKDLSIRNGSLYDAGFISHESAGTQLTVHGDVMLLSGTFDFNRSKAGSSLFTISNTDHNCKWTQRTSCDVSLGNTLISENSNVELMGDKMGDIEAGRSIVVSKHAGILCGKYQVTGSGTFDLGEYATIGIGHPKGISSTEEAGNIITKNRMFHSGASYCYYQGENPQITGAFATRPQQNTIRSLIIQKDKNTQTVTLSQDLAVMENVKINRGDLDQSKKKLILPKTSER